jgi:hypothetical protein
MDAIGLASHLPRVHCSTEPSRHQATSGQGAWSGVHRAGIRLFELGLVVPSPTAPATARSPVCSCLSRGLLGSSSLSYTDTSPKCRIRITICIQYFDTSILFRYRIRGVSKIQYNKINHDIYPIHSDTLSILHRMRTRRKKMIF